ncbi:MAG: MFS transporter [bacterium]
MNKTQKREVLRLGWVSLLTDISSEMLYAINPLFLTIVLGVNMRLLGLIEGIAEGTAALLKGLTGFYSDWLRKRKIFIVIGYTLSAISKPIIGFAISWHWVLGARFLDRFGKGIRTTSRDALIADLTPIHNRGWAFGIHRMMDTLGAFIGVALSLTILVVLLPFFKEEKSLRALYFIAFLPALIGVLITLTIRDISSDHKDIPNIKNPTKDQHILPSRYFHLLGIYSLFALANSSDTFLIMRAKSIGFSTTDVLLLYLIFNASYGLLSYPMGRLSDRFSKNYILGWGMIIYAVVYYGFGELSSRWQVPVLFFLYGGYTAMTEGVSKALVSVLAPPEARGRALGLFYTTSGLLFILASIIAGQMWDHISPSAPFYFGSVLALLAGIGFFVLRLEPPQTTTH